MAQKTQNVLNIIKDQHKILKQSIAVLKSEKADVHKKIENLEKFIDLLKMHSEAEEQTLYEQLGELEEGKMIICESEEEHSIAKKIVDELESANYKNSWNVQVEAKAKVLAEMVEHHAEEEEKETFAVARKNFTSFELEAMGEQFLSICEGFEPQLVPPLKSGSPSNEMPLR
jgi:hemerythrin-like domain-containing protein